MAKLFDGLIFVPHIKNVATIEIEEKELIMCRNCEYWQDNNGGYPHPDCKWNTDETPDPDDFCSCASKLTEQRRKQIERADK